jgi:hypothetical protein
LLHNLHHLPYFFVHLQDEIPQKTGREKRKRKDRVRVRVRIMVRVRIRVRMDKTKQDKDSTAQDTTRRYETGHGKRK